MVTMSKKETRVAQKGKSKALPAPPKSVLRETVPVTETAEEDWASEEEDEESGGVSERGIQRLMELVGEEDLNDMERATLALGEEGSDDEDEDEGDEDEDEGDEDEDEGDEDVEVDGDEEDEEDVEDGAEDEEMGEMSGEGSDEDEEDDDETLLDNSILIDLADPDAIPIDDLASDLSLDEDAVPMRKVTANNKPAMRLLTEKLKVTHLPWPEHLVLSSKEVLTVDPQDDLQREIAFYKLALDQVAPSRKLCAKHDVPFSRPNDYYAEMVKSDEHMERIRTKLVEESTGIKKSEVARKQRDLKKFGKQIQVEKLKQREMDKKNFSEKMQGIKRKRKDGIEGGEGGDDEFGIAIDDSDDRPARGSGGARGARGGRGGVSGRGARGAPKMPRNARDSKYSLGGGGKRSKQNTKESTNDFAGWGGGGGGGGGRGGRGGGRGGQSGRGGRGGKPSRGQNRPGKSRRQKGRA